MKEKVLVEQCDTDSYLSQTTGLMSTFTINASGVVFEAKLWSDTLHSQQLRVALPLLGVLHVKEHELK